MGEHRLGGWDGSIRRMRPSSGGLPTIEYSTREREGGWDGGEGVRRGWSSVVATSYL